jgi:hypothetical protein
MNAAENPTPSGDDPKELAEELANELDRLRRQLRAQSVVNRQLYAQLEGGSVRVATAGSAEGARKSLNVPRVTEGGSWLEQLQMHGGGKAFLVQTPTQGSYVIDGDMRRQVKAGMLFAALTRVIGTPRDVADDDLQKWSPGPPVEVLESGTGPAFLVVGGRRLPLRGLPLPYLVTNDDALLFPEGEELNVAASVRKAPPSRSTKARQVLEKEGPVRGSAKLARKAMRRITG